jgi:hypothetical protein
MKQKKHNELLGAILLTDFPTKNKQIDEQKVKDLSPKYTLVIVTRRHVK